MNGKWIGIWNMPQFHKGISSLKLAGKTCRLAVKSSVSGETVRVRIANRFCNSYMRIDSASVCLCDKEGRFTASPVKLTFAGEKRFLLPAGEEICSDEIKLHIPQGSYIAVSLYFGSHAVAVSGNYTYNRFLVSVPGDYTMDSVVDYGSTFKKLLTVIKRILPSEIATLDRCAVISGVDVLNAGGGKSSCVALLSDGTGAGAGFTSKLMSHLEDKYAGRYQLVDESICDNKLLYGDEKRGIRGADRICNALSVPGVSHIIVMLGRSDIINVTKKENSVAQDIVNAYKSIAEKAHKAGVKAIVCTIPPIDMCKNCTGELERRRKSVNEWLRTKGERYFDAVADISSVLEGEDGNANELMYTDKGEINYSGAEAMSEEFIKLKKVF